jgi:hypothetical protein
MADFVNPDFASAMKTQNTKKLSIERMMHSIADRTNLMEQSD